MTREEQQDLLEQAIRYIEIEGNHELGTAYMLRAAEGGHPEAMFYYGQYLLYEKRDATTAVDWYEKSYRAGYELDLREEYRSGTDAFRAAIDARFSPEEKKRMSIRPQSSYDLQARLFMLLFCCGVGFILGRTVELPYSPWVGMGVGLLIAACAWKHITYTLMLSLGEKKKKG